MRQALVAVVLACGGAACLAKVPAPQLLYTDIVSGPNQGGEDDHGAYLTLYGRHFGAARGSSRVLIGGTEVSAYRSWSDTRIAVQPGRRVGSGQVQIVVDGVASGGDAHFTVRPGKIFFVALDGSDETGRPGDIGRPFRNAQRVFNSAAFGPGDFLVLRGGRWTDLGDYDSRFLNIGKSGAPGAPLAVTAYPGEQVVISPARGQTAFRLYRYQAQISHIVISNFDIRLEGDGGCILLGAGSEDLRVVGNEGQGQKGRGGGGGCITGSGSRMKILGNRIHDNGGDKLFHAIYIDNDFNVGVCDDVEIAYNHIYNQRDPAGSGRGIQIYWEGSYRIAFTNFHIHHNVIHDIDRDGITLGNQSGAGFDVHDNVIYRTGLVWGAGIRFSGRDLEVRVYNNTVFDVARSRDVGAVWFERFKRAVFVNNIVQTRSPAHYLTVDRGIDSSAVLVTNNLWFGVGSPPALDRRPVNHDAAFADPMRGDFRILPGSPAIGSGVSLPGVGPHSDMAGVMRPARAAPDLGAYRFENTRP